MRNRFAKFLQLAGLTLMPVAVIYGLEGGSIYTELLMFAGAMGLWITGTGLRRPDGGSVA